MGIAPERIALDLLDHHGQPFTLANLAGRHSLVYFGFLHCKVVCPRSLAQLATICEALGPDQDRIRVLYVSVDPERDTPEAMRVFLEARYPKFTGLTGPLAAIDSAKQSLKVFSRKVADPDEAGNYLVPHTAWVYLVDDSGRYVTHFAEHLGAEEIVARISAIVRPKGSARSA